MILDRESYDLWLDPRVNNLDAVSELLKPYSMREVVSGLSQRSLKHDRITNELSQTLWIDACEQRLNASLERWLVRKPNSIEAAFRAPEIVHALESGKRLPFALYRMEGKSPRLYLAWSPTRTAKPNFHVPEAFGTLLLD